MRRSNQNHRVHQLRPPRRELQRYRPAVRVPHDTAASIPSAAIASATRSAVPRKLTSPPRGDDPSTHRPADPAQPPAAPAGSSSPSRESSLHPQQDRATSAPAHPPPAQPVHVPVRESNAANSHLGACPSCRLLRAPRLASVHHRFTKRSPLPSPLSLDLDALAAAATCAAAPSPSPHAGAPAGTAAGIAAHCPAPRSAGSPAPAPAPRSAAPAVRAPAPAAIRARAPPRAASSLASSRSPASR